MSGPPAPLDPPQDCVLSTPDTLWVSFCAVFVLGMMPALGMFEAGILGKKSTVSVFTQIFAGCAALCCLWFVCGFSIVFGPSYGSFIGSPHHFPLFINLELWECLPPLTIPGIIWAIFQMMFAAITPLLITGAYAERLLFRPFLVFTVLWEVLVYYPVAHWLWNANGWLAKLGALDFAGGIVVHITAGVAAVVTAIEVGHRRSLRSTSSDIQRHPHSAAAAAASGIGRTTSTLKRGAHQHGPAQPSNLPLAAIGATLLWMGWFSFNAGSAAGMDQQAVAAIVNTQVASVFGSVSWLLMTSHRPSAIELMNGAVAGLAGVTPAAGYISPWAAAVLGVFNGVGSRLACKVLEHLHIDDAVEVSAVHGVPGLIGSLCIGIFANPDVDPTVNAGVIYGRHSWYLLGAQVAAICATIVWTAVFTVASLRLTRLLFRVVSTRDAHDDRYHRGLDCAEHGVAAYGPEESHPHLKRDPSMPAAPRAPAVRHDATPLRTPVGYGGLFLVPSEGNVSDMEVGAGSDRPTDRLLPPSGLTPPASPTSL